MVRVIRIHHEDEKGAPWMMVSLCRDTTRDLSIPEEKEKQKEEDKQGCVRIMHFKYSDRLKEHLETHDKTLKHGSFEEKIQVYLDYAIALDEYYKDKERRKGWTAD